jgi:hypothetical protein
LAGFPKRIGTANPVSYGLRTSIKHFQVKGPRRELSTEDYRWESKLEGLEGNVLGSEEKFTGEGRFGWAAPQRLFGGKNSQIGIIVLLRHVREDQIAGVGVEAIGIREVFAYRMIGKMSGARKDALFHDPRVGAHLEHVEVMIGFKNEAIGLAEMNFDEFGHVAKVGADGYLGAIGAKGKADGIDGVVRNGEGVHVDIADREALARLNGFDASQTLTESFRENTLKRAQGGLGNVKRSLPQAQDLRESIAVIGMLVGDEDGIEMFEVALDGGESSKGFAFAEAGVHKDAGAFGFEQGEIARTAGRKNGDAQPDWKCPPEKPLGKLFK